MSQTLYVGNVSYQATDDGLTQHFAAAGQVVSAKIVMDKFTGRSRGFAFIEMASDEDAQKAIEMLDGKDYEGRPLRVNVARPKEERPQRSYQN